MKDLQELRIAQNEYTEALIRLATAKFQLEDAKAVQVIQGVEGKNQMERDARLRDNLEHEYSEEHKANIKVIAKRGAYQNAKESVEWLKIGSQI